MLDRRRFLAASALGSLPAFLNSSRAQTPKSEPVRLAVIGVAGRGAENLTGVASETIVALCDVDESRAIKARTQFPKAEFFTDYRKLFDKLGKQIDAVVVSTPDHTHAHAALTAASLGKHIYCEKPLCHTVEEVRRLMKAASDKKLVTQMGTQIHSGENYRRVVEIVKSGKLGAINKVSVWCSRRPDPGRIVRNAGAKTKVDTDLWLGPIPDDYFRANQLDWPHFNWRWWWSFGGGVLADMGCHYLDLAVWALDLGHPDLVKATGTELPNADNTVPETLKVEWTFPATKSRVAIEVSWYHGVPGPSLKGVVKFPGFFDGVLFEGENGKKLLANYTTYKLLPEEFANDFRPPEPSIAKSPGHHQEWLDAIRGTGTPLCQFGYSGVLTQTVLLGNIAYRTGDDLLKWDGAKGTTDSAQANKLLAIEPRKGWEWPE